MNNLLVLGLLVFIEIPSSQDFHIVFLNKKEDKAVLPEDAIKKLMNAHMANINRLAKEGKLWAAGPFDGGGGIFFFKSPSPDEVKSWLMTDSAVAAGRWNVEIFPYQPRTGSVCAGEETAPMVNYFFVRYRLARRDKDQAENHLRYLREQAQATVAEAGLGEENGCMLVLREEPSTDWIQNDPAVKSGSLIAEVKKLWIAKGSFCEPK